MRHQNVWLTLSFSSVLAIVLFFGGQGYANTSEYEISVNGVALRETLELENSDALAMKHYYGPQTAAGLMAAFDAAYAAARPKVTATMSRKKKVEIRREWAEAEIDARYPRAEWLQLLLDKGITITHARDYAMYLAKRHTLALVEDNPKLWQSGILRLPWESGIFGLPRTKDWNTFKAAYLDKWIDIHVRTRDAAASAEEVIGRIAHAQEWIEHAQEWAAQAQERIFAVPPTPATPAIPPTPAIPAIPPTPAIPAISRLSQAQLQLARAKQELARVEQARQRLERAQKSAEAQIKRARQQLKRVQEELERARKRVPPPSHKREPKQDSKGGTL